MRKRENSHKPRFSLEVLPGRYRRAYPGLGNTIEGLRERLDELFRSSKGKLGETTAACSTPSFDVSQKVLLSYRFRTS